MQCWKVYCEEKKFPGLWRRWLREQCVAVGWFSGWGFRLNGDTKDRGWAGARTVLRQIKAGHFIAVHLHGGRIGRIGEVVRSEVQDDKWRPTVPPTEEQKDGEYGRRILVRWIEDGPIDPELVVQLTGEAALTGWQSRATLAQINPRKFRAIRAMVADEKNWCRYYAGFGHERSLSDYIASYPHRLEDGLQPYPNVELRESAFSDRSRADVILMDIDQNPVVVECKQGAATIHAIKQLRGYMRQVSRATKKGKVRGFLVHGGARRLAAEVAAAASKSPRITVLRYRVDVDFDPCSA